MTHETYVAAGGCGVIWRGRFLDKSFGNVSMDVSVIWTVSCVLNVYSPLACNKGLLWFASSSLPEDIPQGTALIYDRSTFDLQAPANSASARYERNKKLAQIAARACSAVAWDQLQKDRLHPRFPCVSVALLSTGEHHGVHATSSASG